MTDKQEPVAWMETWTSIIGTGQRDVSLRKPQPRPGFVITPLYTRANRPADDGLEGSASDNILCLLGAHRDDMSEGAVKDFQALATALRAQSDAEVERN